MKKEIKLFVLLCLSMLIVGCANDVSDTEVTSEDNIVVEDIKEETEFEETTDVEVAEVIEDSAFEETEVSENEIVQEIEPEIFDFVDVFGEHYQTELNPEVRRHDYNSDCFIHDGHKLSYVDDPRYDTRLGVDVSYHQGKIDWEKVKNAGYDFAFIRIGYRGYGSEGKLGEDRLYKENIQNAKNAGLDVGVYFFAQAINEAEAIEEAHFVLDLLDGENLQLPVVYDPESILDAKARTDDVTGEQFTKNALAFIDVIKQSGYTPMIYSNMLWEAFELDLSQFPEVEIWYADYEPKPQTPYHFTFWQYTNEGIVDGISGITDLDIQLIEKE